jgi:hypothetical protein
MQTYNHLYTILSNKPHNSFYLDRYVKFILACIDKNSSTQNLIYVEQHHIAPKSKDMFPEYTSFKRYPWNKAILTYRQHIISHILLYKTYETQSQLLSILRTYGQKQQKHIENLNLTSVNSRFIESTKQKLSDIRKNKPSTMSEETRKNLSIKMSTMKKEFYSNPKNRKKQSEACKGTTGRKSEKYSIAARNRSETHKQNLSKQVKNHYIEKKKLGMSSSKMRDGLYVTPIGVLSNAFDYRGYCKNSNKPFNIHHIKKNPKLNLNVLGKTPKELGFFFIPKSSPLLEEYYDVMNQVHQPEPNHLLASELNDFLLPKILHHL